MKNKYMRSIDNIQINEWARCTNGEVASHYISIKTGQTEIRIIIDKEDLEELKTHIERALKDYNK